MIRAALVAAAVAGGGDYPPPSHPGAADERPPGPHDVHRVCAQPRCFATIRAAVRAAGAGDRVVVAPGRYRETVRIAGAARRFLRVGGRATVDRVVVDAATGVRISGLSVRKGILVRDASDTTLRHLTVHGGIRLRRAEGGTLARSSVTGPAAALSIERTPDQARPRRTMLRRVALHSSRIGLRLAGARWVTGTDLRFRNNAVDVAADDASGEICLPDCS